MKLLKRILASDGVMNSPQRSTTNLDLDTSENVAYAAKVNNLPQLKTSYIVTGGLIGKEPRKCSEF